MSQRLGDLRTCETTLHATAYVRVKLVILAHAGECGNRDQASIADAEVAASPEVTEDDIVG